MTLLIIIGDIIVYFCVGAFICGIYDEFIEINRYVLFWPFIVIGKIFKKLFNYED